MFAFHFSPCVSLNGALWCVNLHGRNPASTLQQMRQGIVGNITPSQQAMDEDVRDVLYL